MMSSDIDVFLNEGRFREAADFVRSSDLGPLQKESALERIYTEWSYAERVGIGTMMGGGQS